MTPTLFETPSSGLEDERFIQPHDPYKALYLHIPFCVSRCNYCDFHTQACAADDGLISEYIEQLSLAIRRAGRLGELGALETVYIGGGTPSHVGLSGLSMLLYTLSLSMHLTEEVECTMEANPESLSERMVRDLWALGVNRLSLGVQSFDDGVLRILGRPHNADEARRAIQTAQTRFDNVSIDLIAGIPGTPLQAFVDSVQEAIDLGIPHVSIYPLTLEEGTPLAQLADSGRISEPDEDEQADALLEAQRLLFAAGYQRYEVASYAKPGYACRHNEAYWIGLPYLGLGEGATTMTQGCGWRKRITFGSVDETLTLRERVAEDLMLGMRRSAGVSDVAVSEAQCLIDTAKETFAELETLGLVEHKDKRWLPTELGWLCGNELYGRLLELGES